MVVAGVVFFASFASAEDGVQKKLDTLMDTWISSLPKEDIDALISCYWPDATKVVYNPNGQSYMLEGSAAIKQDQQAWFDGVDYAFFNLKYPEPERFLPKSGGTPVYIYNYTEHNFIDVFYFQNRSGTYRIIRHMLLVDPQGKAK